MLKGFVAYPGTSYDIRGTISGVCNVCGERYYGWAILNPAHQDCWKPRCNGRIIPDPPEKGDSTPTP